MDIVKYRTDEVLEEVSALGLRVRLVHVEHFSLVVAIPSAQVALHAQYASRTLASRQTHLAERKKGGRGKRLAKGRDDAAGERKAYKNKKPRFMRRRRVRLTVLREYRNEKLTRTQSYPTP